MQPPIPRMNVLGVGVYVEDSEKATAAIVQAAERNQRGYVAFLAVHGVMEAYRDAVVRRIFNRALLCNPDGMPLTWIGRLQGFHDIRRVYGPI
jgi:N-acetylglucosaminyldiphosphoundecaprenol N-acetyl-beta-D-mannosaminyltransferase